MTTESVPMVLPAKNKVGRPQEWDYPKVVQTLLDCEGNYSEAARRITLDSGRSIHQKTIYRIVHSNPDWVESVERADWQSFDHAHQTLKNYVKQGNLPASIKIFDRKGWKYGHGPQPRQTELTGKGGGPILTQEIKDIEKEVAAMSREQRDAVLERGRYAEAELRRRGVNPGRSY